MGYLRSKFVLFGPIIVGAFLFLIGIRKIIILSLPDQVINSGMVEKASIEEGLAYSIFGILLIPTYFIWYWFIKDHKKPIFLNIVKVRKKKNFFKTFLIAWLGLFLLFFILNFFRYGSETLNLGRLLLLALIGNGFLFFVLYPRSDKKITEQVSKWAQTLSYSPVTEAQFSFPDRIFMTYDSSGVADFVFKKEIAGMPVRLFQYSDMNSYSVITISTKDELPSFSLAPVSRPETGTGLFYAPQIESEVDAKLEEEIPGSSKIPFRFSSGGNWELGIARKFEIEALQIFSQKLVEHISKNWPQFLIIGKGRDLIAISTERIETEEKLKSCDALASFLVENIALRIKFIGKSVEEMKKVMGTGGENSWS